MDFLPGEWLGFPYAIRLAEERGALRVHVQPRITDSALTGEIRPDVYGERPSRLPIIIEVEDSVGHKFQTNGPRHRESNLVGKAEFVFILGVGARGCKKRLRLWFGDSVELIDLEDLIAKHGVLGVASTAAGSVAPSNSAPEPAALQR